MPDVNSFAVLVATFAAFGLSATYHMVVGDQLAEVSEAAARGDQPPPWKIAAELARSLIIAAVSPVWLRRPRPTIGRAASG